MKTTRNWYKSELYKKAVELFNAGKNFQLRYGGNGGIKNVCKGSCIYNLRDIKWLFRYAEMMSTKLNEISEAIVDVVAL